MTRNEELALVVGLACLAEDRTDAEQRALLRLAWDCDREHNRMVTGNRARRQPGWSPQNLVGDVLESRELQEGQREVAAPKGWVEAWERWDREGGLVAGAGRWGA